jgi:hypothetical protein
MNRATAETAHDAAVGEGLAPVQNWVKQLIDYVIVTEFASPDLEFAWRDDREVDPETLANIARTYVTTGIKTINEARRDIGLDPVAYGDTPMVFTGSGPVPLGGNAANGNAAPGATTAKDALTKYSADQPRDEQGRWTSGSGGVQVAANDDGTRTDAGGASMQVAAGGEEDERAEDVLDPVAPVRRAEYFSQQQFLGAIGARAHDATSVQTKDWIPTDDDLREIANEVNDAIKAAAQNPDALGSRLGLILQRYPDAYANARAAALQSALPDVTKDKVTVAVGVVEDAEGQRSVVISPSENDRALLRLGARDLRQPDETIVPRYERGTHAEIKVLNYARENNLKPIAVGSGRPYCTECGPALDAAGVLATGPRK